MLTTYLLDILQNAPFRCRIFKIFFVSGGKGALTPLAQILRTFLPLFGALQTDVFLSFRENMPRPLPHLAVT